MMNNEKELNITEKVSLGVTCCCCRILFLFYSIRFLEEEKDESNGIASSPFAEKKGNMATGWQCNNKKMRTLRRASPTYIHTHIHATASWVSFFGGKSELLLRERKQHSVHPLLSPLSLAVWRAHYSIE